VRQAVRQTPHRQCALCTPPAVRGSARAVVWTAARPRSPGASGGAPRPSMQVLPSTPGLAGRFTASHSAALYGDRRRMHGSARRCGGRTAGRGRKGPIQTHAHCGLWLTLARCASHTCRGSGAQCPRSPIAPVTRSRATHDFCLRAKQRGSPPCPPPITYHLSPITYPPMARSFGKDTLAPPTAPSRTRSSPSRCSSPSRRPGVHDAGGAGTGAQAQQAPPHPLPNTPREGVGAGKERGETLRWLKDGDSALTTGSWLVSRRDRYPELRISGRLGGGCGERRACARKVAIQKKNYS